MTWAELMEANEAFDELLDLKEKQAEKDKEKMKNEIPKLKLKNKYIKR